MSGEGWSNDEFDSFLESTLDDEAERQEFDRRLLELTPTVNDTLRQLHIPLFHDASDEEIDTNTATLLVEILEQENKAHPEDPEMARMFAEIKVSSIIVRQAITVLELKSLIMEATDNPSEANAIKHRAIANQLFNKVFEIGDPWFQAFDLLIPGAPFDDESEAAQQGYIEALQDSARREATSARQIELAQEVEILVRSVSDDIEAAERIIMTVVTQFPNLKLFPADAEAKIDEVLRETNLQDLKPALYMLFEDTGPSS